MRESWDYFRAVNDTHEQWGKKGKMGFWILRKKNEKTNKQIIHSVPSLSLPTITYKYQKAVNVPKDVELPFLVINRKAN